MALPAVVDNFVKSIVFKKKLFGGIDEADALTHMRELCVLYQKELSVLTEETDALRKERDDLTAETKRLTDELDEATGEAGMRRAEQVRAEAEEISRKAEQTKQECEQAVAEATQKRAETEASLTEFSAHYDTMLTELKNRLDSLSEQVRKLQ